MKQLFIFDCEVGKYDWLFVFKSKPDNQYIVIHNDMDELVEFFRYYDPLVAGFNNKHYDQFIAKAAMYGASPELIKELNDYIIIYGKSGWEIPMIRESRIFFDQYDLMDDCQEGTSLKSIEAHLGMDIRETTVSFDLDRPWTKQELEEMVFYCKHDVDATDILNTIRIKYLQTKIDLGATKGISSEKSLYMTNAKLTAVYLDAKPPESPWTDERDYEPPPHLLWEYIPEEVRKFFDDIHDLSIPSEEYFKRKLKIMVGECPVTLAFGGIHGAIPCYKEKSTETRKIRNKDVASYYPNDMRINKRCSRAMPSPVIYTDTIDDRVVAKKSGDSAKANALKLVLNTTYGSMLCGKNGVGMNDLYDPKMGRSVCIDGQLQLLELAFHCIEVCPTLRIIQVNTDGIMVSFDNCDEPAWQEVTQDWERRHGFTLEEDFIKLIVQRDVNNYVEVPMEGKPKVKGGVLVRGVLTNSNIDFTEMGFPPWNNLNGGAFSINNNAVIVAKAVLNYLAYDIPVEETINNCGELLFFQLVSKCGGSYSGSYWQVGNEYREVQKVNRVYACMNWNLGTVYKKNRTTGNLEKIAGLPMHCAVDNDNQSFPIENLDREWYIRLARKHCNEFLGIKPPKRNTRKVNAIKKKLLEGL